MTRFSVAAAAFGSILTLAACAGTNSATPNSPTPTPSASVTAVAVTSTTPSGSAFQLMATARLSDGSARDVTALATWSSSNAAIATVSSTGAVTVVGSGEVQLRATYQNVMGMLAMQLASGFSLSGSVDEVGPSAHAVANARVAIVGGPGAGTFTTSDASGFFRLDGLTGVVALEATLNGYLTWRLANLTVDHDMQMQVVLYPTPPPNAAGATATARCADGTWSWSVTVAEACAANGGILYGVCPGVLCAATRSVGAIR